MIAQAAAVVVPPPAEVATVVVVSWGFFLGNISQSSTISGSNSTSGSGGSTDRDGDKGKSSNFIIFSSFLGDNDCDDLQKPQQHDRHCPSYHCYCHYCLCTDVD